LRQIDAVGGAQAMQWKIAGASGIARQVDVYVDFDGTIAPTEPTDALFDRFADPAWRELDAAWQAGRLASWEATAASVALLRASPEEITAFLKTIPVDPAFPAFVELCRRSAPRICVVSDGLDLVVRTVLRAAGIDLPCFANQLVWVGGLRWEARFPHRRAHCASRMGNCKCAHRHRPVFAANVMVGDGRSDFCIAERCGLVIAKGSLLRHCRTSGLEHIGMLNFADACRGFARWLARHEGRRAPAPSFIANATMARAAV
jgi:2,3-diketo-5-methylthio-1-phosphopentane phosphatase